FEQILERCNSIKDIREAAKNYPILQQELNNSLQLVKELLNNAATAEDINQLFDAILRLDQTILKTDKTWKSVKNKQISLQPINELELENNSESEFIVTRLKSKSKKRVSSEIESSNSEHIGNNSDDSLNQNMQYSDSEIWKNLFYANTDINNSEFTYSEESDYYNDDKLANSKANVDDSSESIINELISGEESNYDNNELANCEVNDNDSSESINNELVNSEESDYDSETKSLLSLDADKTMIKQLFEKLFINDGLTCNSPMEKAYYSAQIFSLLCFNCGDTDIVTPIPATQYPLCTECTQKGLDDN
ncbi:6623_t:CDS:2, partial [Racocetra fulgida]